MQPDMITIADELLEYHETLCPRIKCKYTGKRYSTFAVGEFGGVFFFLRSISRLPD